MSEGFKKAFTITERFLARWLVETYVQWGYRSWKWRDDGAICFSLSDALRTSKIIDVLVNNKSTIMPMVCTFSDHRNDQEMVKMFKTLQRNISPAAHGYTWVLNILASIFSMVYKSTDHGKLHAVDLLLRHIGRVRKSIRGVALLPPTRLRGWRGI